MPGQITGFISDGSVGLTLFSPSTERFRITAVSDDGATAVRYTHQSSGQFPTLYVWRDGIGFTPLGGMPPDSAWGATFEALSGDGQVAGGNAYSHGANKPFLWTQASGFYPLFGAATGVVDPYPQDDVHLVDLSTITESGRLPRRVLNARVADQTSEPSPGSLIGSLQTDPS